MANSENESVWEVLGEARLGATGDMPFAYRVGLPDEPEIIDVSTKKIIKPRAIRIKNVTLTELLDRIEAALKRNGNAAAMHKALANILGIADHLQMRCEMSRLAACEISELKRIARAALSAPPRVCDIMSLESARKLWFAKEIMPRLDGDLPLGKEIPFDEWFVAQLEQGAKGEGDGR